MTCEQALTLIETLPFTADRPHQVASLRAHARDCPRCRAALKDAEALDSALSQLTSPEAPQAMATVIMARTAQLEERPTFQEVEVRRDRRAWAALLAGGAIGPGALVYRWLAGESAFSFMTSPLGGLQGILTMPSLTPAVLVLAASLILYLAGLFRVSD